MQDPAITVMAALKSGWILTGALAKANIGFRTGAWMEEQENLQITVTEIDALDEPFELGYGVVRIHARMQIDIWVKVQLVSAKGPGIALDNLWSMREHLKSILKANLTGLTGLRLLIMDQIGRRIDEPDASPPIFRWSQDVRAIYDI